MSDLKISGGGTIYLVRPITAAGRKFLEDTAPEDAQFFGSAMAVEHRYIENVVEVARNYGLEVA